MSSMTCCQHNEQVVSSCHIEGDEIWLDHLPAQIITIGENDASFIFTPVGLYMNNRVVTACLSIVSQPH